MGKATKDVEYDAFTLKVAKALDVDPAEVLGTRVDPDDDDALYAVIADGRKVCIRGKEIEVLKGPGYVDPDAAADDLTADELLAEVLEEHRAAKRSRRSR